VAVRLAERNLGTIEALGVAVPHYDRAALAPRILHLGVGGFHRAHMALYTAELAEAGSDWGIRGVGLLEADRRMADALGGQDHLYTLIERDSSASHPRVIASIVDYALSIGQTGPFAAHLADPELAIFSLTITEGGYSLTEENPTLVAIATGLEARRRGGGSPLTILSCDNLPGNGKVARTAIMSVCESLSSELARYVDEACTFPNSMVDRITPQTAEADRTWLSEVVGIDDAWPVVAEPFRQWVVEDDFAAGRPRYEDVGALFTDRVHDWELYKLRMLNASHSSMAYLMALADVTYVDEAMAIAPLRAYLERFLADEAIPTLDEIPGHPPSDYACTVLHRFENTGVRDQIARLCIDGTAKFPSFLIPTVQRELDLGGPVECAALALAGWARYLAVTARAERAPDPRGARAAALAVASLDDPLAFLELEEVFTPALRESDRFRDSFAQASRTLAEHGSLGAIERLGAGHRLRS
jgi:mannitol 2-dehydrogenase